MQPRDIQYIIHTMPETNLSRQPTASSHEPYTLRLENKLCANLLMQPWGILNIKNTLYTDAIRGLH